MEDSTIRMRGFGAQGVDGIPPRANAPVINPGVGDRRFEKAKLVDINSDVTDLQEELGMSVGKLVDKRSLQKAKLRQGASVNKEALKRIADYLDKLEDAPHDDKLLELIERLETLESALEKDNNRTDRLTFDEVMEAFAATDRDPRRQYMLLQGAHINFEAKATQEHLVSVLDAVETSFQESGIAASVRAEYAMLSLAKNVAPAMGIPVEALCDKYRDMLLTGMNIGQIFYALADLQKQLHLDTVVDLFMKAAGNDLSATTRGTDRVFLASLLKWLGVLKTMRGTLEACGELLDTTRRICPGFAQTQQETGPAKLMGALLTFCARPIPNLDDCRSIIEPFEDGQITAHGRVMFFNGLVDVHRKIPDQAIGSAKMSDQEISSARLRQNCTLLVASGHMVDLEAQEPND